MMNIRINGKQKTLKRRLTIRQLLLELDYDMLSVAIALNQEFVPRNIHGDTWISEGDDIEIVTARQGG